MHKAVLLMVTMLWMLVGCEESVSDWPAREAQIVEAGTGKPLADVIVVALWKGTASYSNTVCFHVETATTDKEGRFRIPAWTNTTEWRYTENQGMGLTFYKAGYMESEESKRVHMPDQALFSLKPFEGGVAERLEYLSSSRGAECGEWENYSKSLAPFYRALYMEAESIARSPGERKVVKSLRYSLDIMELGYEAAQKRLTEGAYD